MDRQLCIHGHFYQPPREDPWLGQVLPEGSAAPFTDWNARIARESYGPLAHARVLDGQGRINRVVNSFEWMSFNAGPTLMGWLERTLPQLHERMVKGDAASRERLGFGNAVAQARHHQIMPLATPGDREIEVAWGVEDFRARFGRDPDGMWLPEAAVDTPTLEALAAAGLAFTVLAPSQARSVRGQGQDDWLDVDESGLDISVPYRIDLPSGRKLAVFFYHGSLSQAVAFERLLDSGQTFWDRLAGAAGPGLLSLATDGETYGHHFTFGEMALAFVLDKASRPGNGLAMTNYAAFLADNPPRAMVRLHEPSSWSCVHGVERWRADCGCNTGERPEWNQGWRVPLRQALAGLKSGLDRHFKTAGTRVMDDPGTALLDYGSALAGTMSWEDFSARHVGDVDGPGGATAWKLLAMQRHGLASLASCAWFFDDLARIEPINAMGNACRAMELAAKTGGPDLMPEFLDVLGRARANPPDGRNGADIFRQEAEARQETPASLTAQALMLLWARHGSLARAAGRGLSVKWPRVRVEISFTEPPAGDGAEGRAMIYRDLAPRPREYDFQWKPAVNGDPMHAVAAVRPVGDDSATWDEFSPASLSWNKREAIVLERLEHAEDESWERSIRDARDLLPLYQAYSESQTGPISAWQWRRLWPALAWEFAAGRVEAHKARAELVEFLKDAKPSPDRLKALEERLEQVLTGCLAADPPDRKRVVEMVERIRELGLDPDLWTVQNMAADDAGQESADLRRVLGFVEPGS